MARPLRIEFAGALYHVTSRGDRRERICEDDGDRKVCLEIPCVMTLPILSPESRASLDRAVSQHVSSITQRIRGVDRFVGRRRVRV